MKELIINKDNLNDDDVKEVVTRVKAIMINDNDEILLAYCDDDYQFPGGHLKDGENVYDGLIREVKEETGIEAKKDDFYPFIKIKHYSKNYFRTNENRLNIMIYFVYKKSTVINNDNINISDYERKNEFKLCFVKLSEVEEILIDHVKKFPRFRYIAYEMLPVLEAYKKLTIHN